MRNFVILSAIVLSVLINLPLFTEQGGQGLPKNYWHLQVETRPESLSFPEISPQFFKRYPVRIVYPQYGPYEGVK